MKELDLHKIETLPFFSKEQIRTLFSDADEKAIDQNIYRWLQKGTLISLKRGLYVTRTFFDKNRTSISFAEFISTILKKPSYLSLEYVLRKYEILTEATFGLTSITLKPGSIIENDLGTFTYRNIKRELFTGYVSEYFLDNELLIASKAKALFDYIYFKSGTLSENAFENRNLVDDLRLNLDTFDSDTIAELRSYCELDVSAKVKSIISNIADNAPNS